MVVDDVVSNRKLLAHALRRLGATDVVEAVDGRVALDTVCAELGSAGGKAPAVVFLDKEMPVMDGYDALVAMREAGYEGRVVGVTGSAYQQDLDGFLGHGADAVLAKPVSRARLSDCLSTLLSHEPHAGRSPRSGRGRSDGSARRVVAMKHSDA